jgi:small-conductance mechanosensitive channel
VNFAWLDRGRNRQRHLVVSVPSQTLASRPERVRRGSALALALALCLALVAADAAADGGAPVPVRVGDAVVFNLAAEADGRPSKERAARAAAAIASVLEQPAAGDVHVENTPRLSVISVGPTAIVELTPADAALAGDLALEAYAGDRANALRLALSSERKRSQIAETVFSWSLVVFFALIAFYLIKRVTTLTERARAWLDQRGDRALAVSVKSIELVRPAVVKSSAVIALGLGRWLGQFGIFYAWLAIVLSLFEATRGYTERLTGFVLSPLSQLFGRVAVALPLLVVAAFAALAVFVLVRFTGLFLASVARRETRLDWLPADVAGPASVLARIAIVVGALVFAAPLVTGSADDSLARLGTIVLWALGLAAVPLFATGLLGAAVIFDRRLGVGDHVRIRGQVGRVVRVDLLELRLLTPSGSEWRVPHLSLLTHPLERLGAAPRSSLEIAVRREHEAPAVLGVLREATARLGQEAAVEIADVDLAHVRYRITATLSRPEQRSELLAAALGALYAAGMDGRDALAARRE